MTTPPGGPRRLGIVGLGAMGRPIARHLIDAGFEVAVCDLDTEVVAELSTAGAEVAASPKALGSCDIVFVMVPTDDDVRHVCLGEDGIVAGAKDGATIVINSSVTAETCSEVEAAAGSHGVAVLDAALTGGVRGAVNGKINLLVGGDEDVLDAIRPALEPWTKAVHLLGPLGSGQVGKTVNNLCHWIQIAGINEALRLGRLLGVAPSRLRAALLDGSVRSGTLAEIDLMHFTWWKKDIDNARLMAETVAYELPVTNVVYDLMPSITIDRVVRLINDEDPDAVAGARD